MDDCNRDPALKPWAVSAAGYPRGGEAGQKLRFLVRYSVLAPSGHNTQPWLFKFRDKAIELHADRARALPVIDPDDRELIISCGAALETLYVAMRQFGHDGAVRLAPHPGDRDLLARVSLEDGDPPDQDENELFAAIPRRRTNRQAFEARDIPGELADQLDADADADALEVSPCLVRGADRAAVADLVTEGDRTRMADKRFRRELAAWVHPNRGRTRDGMRGCGFGVGDLMSYGGPVVIGRSIWEGAEHCSASCSGHGRTASGPRTSTSPSRPVRCGRSSTIGRTAEFPQLIVRFGFGTDTKAQPRRPVNDVIIDSDKP